MRTESEPHHPPSHISGVVIWAQLLNVASPLFQVLVVLLRLQKHLADPSRAPPILWDSCSWSVWCFCGYFCCYFWCFFVRLGDEFRHLPWVCGGIAEFVAIRMAVLCGH